MPKLPRNVVRRGSYYYLRVRIGGREIRKSLGTNLQEARRRIPLEKQRLQQRLDQRLDVEEPTCKSFSRRWLSEYVSLNRNSKGQRLAEQRLRTHIWPVLGEQRLSEVDRSTLARLRLSMEKKGLAVLTVRHVLSDVRCLLNYAVELNLLQRSPFPRRRLMPKAPEELPRSLTDQEVGKLLMVLCEPQAFAVRLALLTGLRWGELRSLRWSQVRFEPDGCLELERTKSGRVRRVPLSSEASHLLNAEWARQRGLRVPSVHVLPIRYKNAGSFVTRSWERCGFRWNFHQTRHTFARRFLERGGSLPVLQQILGHSTVRMTQRYARLTDRHVMEEARRIDLQSGHNGGHTVVQEA